MSPLVFSAERWGEIRKTPDSPRAVLALRTAQRPIRTPEDFRVVKLYRREVEPGRASTLARLDGGRDAESSSYEELEDRVATIIAWEDVDVYAPADRPWGRALTKADAEALNFRTLADVRAAWRARHPRSDFARLTWFLLGDRRDRTVWLASTQSMVAGRQGDYTQNASKSIDPDAPLLSPAEYAVFAMQNAQKDAARVAERQSRYAGESLAERAARIERGSQAARDRAARDLRSISRK